MAPDHIAEVEKKTGESLSVVFKEAVGGGYLWHCAPQPGLTITDHLTPNEDPEAIGGHARRAFTIVADKAGTYDLVFQHKRPWEDTPEEEIKIRLTVTPA